MSAPSPSRGIGWPIAVAAILAATVAGNVYVAFLANDDPSFAVEHDYYQRALHWDDEMAQARRNEALGWHIATELEPIAGADSTRLLARLTDARGLPVSGAVIRVAARHNARAAEIYDAVLRPLDEGGYVAAIPMHRAGQWELRFEATRGADRFTALERVEETRVAPRRLSVR